MKRNNKLKSKSFLAALMLCLVSALALTAGIVYNRKSREKTPELADLNETTAEFATAEEVVENHTSKKREHIVPIETEPMEVTTAADIAGIEELTTVPETVEEENQAVIGHVVEESTQAAEEAGAGITQLHFDTASSMQWPITGEVVLEYSMDKTIYFPTLDVYKCNSGMMIQGDENVPVYAAASGIVQDITVSREFGNMMFVDLGDGYTAVYGQLGEVLPAAGEMIEKGQQIGTLGAPTAYYEVEGYNLYFQLTKDGTPTDPLEYLKE